MSFRTILIFTALLAVGYWAGSNGLIGKVRGAVGV